MFLLLPVLFPAAAGIFLSLAVKQPVLRNRLYAAAVCLTDFLCLLSILHGPETLLFTLMPGLTLRFSTDSLGTLFLTAAALLYTMVTFYGFSYLERDSKPQNYFLFHFISFGMMIALCFAGNLVTFYLCFELVTLSTVPLVLYERTGEAVSAGLKYLFYSIGGALMGLFAVFYISYFSGGEGAFLPGGFLKNAAFPVDGDSRKILLAAVMAGLIGFGTKAGLYPMHGWLPSAHPAAPAPASSLLSGIVAKAGILAIIRLVFYSVGPGLLRGTWVQTAWTCLAILTILMGSTMAFREKILKKRLAWSTVSQLSYILLSLSFLTEESLRGGLLHVMAHAASKGCLFLTAGVFIHLLGIRDVGGLRGLGKRLPLTFACFTLSSLSLVGIPPMGGFLSKWVIASAAIGSGHEPFAVLGPVVLLISALLTAGYLLPTAVDAFFPGKPAAAEEVPVPEESGPGGYPDPADEKSPHNPGGKSNGTDLAESAGRESALMTVPMLILSLTALLTGLFGNAILRFFGF